MMNDAVSILGHEIPLYGLCFFAGITLSFLVALPLAKKRGIEIFDLLAAAGYILIFAHLGAKLLFVAVSFRQIIELDLPLVAVLKGGFVFYGGLLGGAFGLWLYIKLYHAPVALWDVLAVVLPLGHAFGRVGCFFGGCCYGIPYDGFLGVTYHETVGMTPLDKPLLAIQLIEAMALAVLFIGLLILFFASERQGVCVFSYLFVYPILRFVLEFFRGDAERGAFLSLSTSQWTSLMLFTISLVSLLYQAYQRRKRI